MCLLLAFSGLALACLWLALGGEDDPDDAQIMGGDPLDADGDGDLYDGCSGHGRTGGPARYYDLDHHLADIDDETT